MARFKWVKLTIDELPVRELTKSDFLVMLALAAEVDQDTFVQRSIMSLCKETGLSHRSVYKSLHHLRELAIIRGYSEPGRTNAYQFLLGFKVGRQ